MVTSSIPRIALTLGDPSGVGPELVARLVSDPQARAAADLFVLASKDELAAAGRVAGVEPPVGPVPSRDVIACVAPDGSVGPVPVGVVSRAGGERALRDLRAALRMHEVGDVDAIVFAPLNKAALTLAGMTEEDELRWFADQLGHDGYTSELNVLPALATSRVTSHIPLGEVARHVDGAGVESAIDLLHDSLAGLGQGRPRLAVCALNPHAGEGGKFGLEEIEVITPAVERARARGLDVEGPFSSDTLFLRARDGDFDGVVTMYHDQGQIAIKLMGFDQGVTVQGGLPVPIVTPAHGTAHDIAGRGLAHVGPLRRAVEVAAALARPRAA